MATAQETEQDRIAHPRLDNCSSLTVGQELFYHYYRMSGRTDVYRVRVLKVLGPNNVEVRLGNGSIKLVGPMALSLTSWTTTIL